MRRAAESVELTCIDGHLEVDAVYDAGLET